MMLSLWCLGDQHLWIILGDLNIWGDLISMGGSGTPVRTLLTMIYQGIRSYSSFTITFTARCRYRKHTWTRRERKKGNLTVWGNSTMLQWWLGVYHTTPVQGEHTRKTWSSTALTTELLVAVVLTFSRSVRGFWPSVIRKIIGAVSCGQL